MRLKPRHNYTRRTKHQKKIDKLTRAFAGKLRHIVGRVYSAKLKDEVVELVIEMMPTVEHIIMGTEVETG